MAIAETLGSDGGGIDLDSAPTTFNYNGDNTVNYIEVIANGNTYRQSFTYNGAAKVLTISEWVKQ